VRIGILKHENRNAN